MAITDRQVEEYVDRGLRNYWYPVLPSWRLREAPLGITRLGESLALWRDREGRAHALEDRCPHRGARLALGWNLGERIACGYHGVEVDAGGTAVKVPAVAHTTLEGRKCVRSYPCREVAGAVFVYFGDALHPEPPALEVPEQLTSPGWGRMMLAAVWNCNYRYAVDNVMDPMHGAYLHAASHSMAEGDKHAEMRIRPTKTGFLFEKVNQRDVNFDWVEWGETGWMWMRLSIPYQKKYGPGGPFYIVAMSTPIDETRSLFVIWRCRRVEGWQRDLWRFLYRNRLEGLHWKVLEQDQTVLENLSPQPRSREFLYQHDTGLARVRRAMQERGREQLKALEAAAADTLAEEAP